MHDERRGRSNKTIFGNQPIGINFFTFWEPFSYVSLPLYKILNIWINSILNGVLSLFSIQMVSLRVSGVESMVSVGIPI